MVDDDQISGTTAWFHCFCGIAGDMAMGALVDAGADLAEIRALCERLPVTGWSLDGEVVMRGGIAATKVHVGAEETSVVRTAAHITSSRAWGVGRSGSPTPRSTTWTPAARALALAASMAENKYGGSFSRRPTDQTPCADFSLKKFRGPLGIRGNNMAHGRGIIHPGHRP